MKCGKAAGTSLIVAEMLKASGVVGAQQIRDLIEDIIHFGKIPTKCPTKWEESIIIFLYKGKGVALEREKLSRPQFARSDHEGSRQGCWELPMTRSAHRWHAVWLHAWTQHHRCHIQCTPDTRKSSMPPTRHCTLPLSIWKRHSIMYPDVSSGGLFTSLALRSGWCGSYSACMKMSESECVLVVSCEKSVLWKNVFIKAFAWSPYCSAWFWKTSS